MKGLDLKVGKKSSKIATSISQYVVLSIGTVYGVLYVLELGIAGIVVAFSSQLIIQNFVAGIIVSLEHRVHLEDREGISDIPTNQPARVAEVDLTRTLLRDTSGNLILFPTPCWSPPK